MKQSNASIKMIAVDSINILNPRVRNAKVPKQLAGLLAAKGG